MYRTMLLDGDIIAYQAGFGLEEEYCWGEGVTSVSADIEAAKDKVNDSVLMWKDVTKADDAIFCLSDPSHRYWRHDVLPSYKHSRSDDKRPRLLDEIRAWMAETFRSYQRPGLEADDVIGILATHPNLVPGEKVIVSSDKDFFQLPNVKILQMHKPEAGILNTGVLTAESWFYMQALMGDPVDGYAGCWKIGQTTARKIVAGGLFSTERSAKAPLHMMCRRMWDAVVGAYRMQYRKYGIDRDPEQDALTQARVSRILRATDYDFKKRRPILWSPPKLVHDPKLFPLWKFKSVVTITNV